MSSVSATYSMRKDGGVRVLNRGFKNDLNDKDQTITFCGVGAHHQNGIVESKNRILTEGARTLLLHVIRIWPQIIDTIILALCFQSYGREIEQITSQIWTVQLLSQNI